MNVLSELWCSYSWWMVTIHAKRSDLSNIPSSCLTDLLYQVGNMVKLDYSLFVSLMSMESLL